MILIDFFTEASCKGTELLEGWYWYEDDGDNVGGPFEDEEDAILAANKTSKWRKDGRMLQPCFPWSK